MSTPKLESHMMAIEKSNDGLSPPPKLLISHGLPVLSGSNPQVVRNHPGSTTTPTTPPKKAISDLPPTHTKNKKTKEKQKKNEDPEKKWGKKKKRELSLRILTRRTRLLTSLYWKRLVRRGLQQQYLIRFSNLVKFIYARNIK